jgi:XTP/dITP diphosphohydrolase
MNEISGRLVLATRNHGKVREIESILSGIPLALSALNDWPEVPEAVEDRPTFEENACKKARVTSQATGIPALADDSGLCVDALGGRPGVLSARYAGDGASDMDKCLRIIDELASAAARTRTARFVCVMVLAFPSGREEVFRGECVGEIAQEPRGLGGFGYDPIFFFGPTGLTFGEMSPEAKNLVSHRGVALQRFARFLRRCLCGAANAATPWLL